MKEIYVTITILDSIHVPDNYREEDVEDVEDAINDFLFEKGLDRDDCNDIEWDEHG